MAPIRFISALSGLIPPMPGDRTALGSAPAAAFQYCEAMAMASAFGWTLFPPCDLRLRWTGREAEVFSDGDWHSLETLSFGAEEQEEWDRAAPEALQGRMPHAAQKLFVPGIVQIWTGYFIESDPDWSVLVRPLPNVPGPDTHFLYEGIVETDQFRPCPLFVNIRLLKTDREILLRASDPLFTVQPVPRRAYAPQVLGGNAVTALSDLPEPSLQAMERTVRLFDPTHGGNSLPGSYGAQVRRRRKSFKTPA